MNGLDISYYCPVCKSIHNKRIGITPYRLVNGKSLAHIRCSHCNNELLVEAHEAFNIYAGNVRYNMQIRDYTKDNFTSLIDKLFDSGLYSEKDSEEFITADIISRLEKATTIIGVSKHILGIKKYIELKMCTKFNNPSHPKLAYVVDTGNSMADKRCLVKLEDTQFDYCICY